MEQSNITTLINVTVVKTNNFDDTANLYIEDNVGKGVIVKLARITLIS